MKKIANIATAIAFAALAGSATAQISNTVYFDKYNYRQHLLNPSFMPDQRFYIGLGTVAADFGNNSIKFNDIFKNVGSGNDKRTVIFLDKALGDAGRKDFLDAIDGNLQLFATSYVDILDFGFFAGKNTFVGVSVGAKVGTNLFIPKSFFEIFLEGMDKEKGITLDAGDISADVYAYAEAGLTLAHRFNEKLTIGVTGKFLQGITSFKTDFSDLTATGSMDQWVLKGNGEVMGSYPGLVVYNDPTDENKLDAKYKKGDDDIKYSDFSGNKGFAFDIGASYKFFNKLTVSASILDLGYINFKDNVGRATMDEDFVYDGADYDINQDETDHKDNPDFKAIGDEFKSAFKAGSTDAFKQKLPVKIYAGASYDLLKIISVGVLSRTAFQYGKTFEEISLSANLHPLRMLSINGTYSLMNGEWGALGLGANLKLGFLNIFAAMDNVPLHYAKLKGDNNVMFPERLKNARVNVGLGLVFGSHERKAKKDKKKKEGADIELVDVSGQNTGGIEPDFFDADGDGVEDANDKCPDTAPGATVDDEGCPLDSDYDGVPDYLDKCPNTPRGATVDDQGCPLDSDGDGVFDDKDKCPNTPAGVQVDKNGCPFDTDEDGVPDYLDKCDNTPAGTTVDPTGCILDTDGDGVPDDDDQCPQVAGPESNHGCPVVKQEVKQLFKKALNGIEFETGKSTIVSTSYNILDDIAKTMLENKEYKLYIKGHTDNDGDKAKNLQLSKDRANEVMKYLVNKGVPASRMHSDGFGDTRPVVPNTTKANKAKNRRVEFEIEF